MTNRILFRLSTTLLGAVASLAFAAAESPPVRGEKTPEAILHELRSFGTMGTVLYVAAHPDDENTQFMAYFSRGRGYRTGYLSLTRGDGGQNELGADFGEKLGVLRTQELLAARRIDGGRQFFTRAIDFGFSKTPEETLRFWDHGKVLADIVRVIRQFRPDVLVTRFPIPPGSGGHGHHTASAMLAVEAFKLAGDPKAYPEQLAQGLAVWQPKRILWNAWGGSRGNGGLDGPTVQLDIGGNDPVTGEPFGTIANRSRGMHKTQGLGGFSGRDGSGPNMQTFMLLAGEPLPGDPARTNTGLAASPGDGRDGPRAPSRAQQGASNGAPDLMDGVDLTWGRIPGGAEIGQLADDLLARFDPKKPATSVPAILAIRAKLAALPADPLLDDKRAALDRILQDCLGLEVETTLAHADVVPGETFQLQHTAIIHSDFPVRWLGQSATETTALTSDHPAKRESSATLPIDASLTQPYWLQDVPTEGTYTVADPNLIGRPESPPAFPIQEHFEVGGQTLTLTLEPVQVSVDPKRGEVRRPLEVVAPTSLEWLHPLELFAPGATKSVTLELTAARAGVHGTLQLAALAGWKLTPANREFRLGAVGEVSRFTFEITAPVQPGAAQLGVDAAIGLRRYHRTRLELRYDHLPVQLLQPDARLELVALDVAVRAKNIGYIAGAGDDVAASLRLLGCNVTDLAADFAPATLRPFDAIVIGVRAFNENKALTANLPALLAYVENGGTVIAQYNRPNDLKDKPLGPYPLSIEGPAPQLRVTDEQSPVTFLVPDHPVFNTPNKIGPADFAGWVQERGAYFPSSWDETHYTPVLAMNDPGEAPLKSSVLIARYGKGYYVYTGLAFFRQLPAGVPGAYRLFANLLSLGK